LLLRDTRFQASSFPAPCWKQWSFSVRLHCIHIAAVPLDLRLTRTGLRILQFRHRCCIPVSVGMTSAFTSLFSITFVATTMANSPWKADCSQLV
jgi:hypothetical protein